MTTRGWAAFGAVSLLWGLPYLLIKIAVEDGVPPLFLSWARVVLGAGILALWAWRAGSMRGLRGRIRWIALFAIAEIVIPFPLIAAAERAVDSSVAAILIATAPLFVAVLALRFDHSERVDRQRFAGLVVGLVGVAALVGLELSGRPAELLGTLAILGAALGYAIGPMIIRARLQDLDPTATMAAALAIAGVVLLPFALVEPPVAVPSTEAIASIVALGVLCTGAALAIYGALVLIAGAGRALLVTYINPLVATTLGVVVLGERPGSGAAVGLTLILAGSWLASRTSLPTHADSVRSGPSRSVAIGFEAMRRDPRVDAYLAALPAEQREVLQALRERVAALAPEATELISYDMPAFKLGDRFLLSYAAWKRHCSIYAPGDDLLAKYATELEGYGRTKGSLHFSKAQPLPDGLVGDYVRQRVASIESGGR